LYKKFFHKEIEEKLFKTKHQCEFYNKHLSLKEPCSYSFVKNSLKILDDVAYFELFRNQEKYVVMIECYSGGIFNITINDKEDRYIANAEIGQNLTKTIYLC